MAKMVLNFYVDGLVKHTEVFEDARHWLFNNMPCYDGVEHIDGISVTFCDMYLEDITFNPNDDDKLLVHKRFRQCFDKCSLADYFTVEIIY